MAPKTMSVHDLTLAAWWNDAQVYSEYFFSTTASLRFDRPDPDLMAGYHELQMIRRSFEQADFPPSAAFARQHLLNSMSKIMSGFEAFVAGNVEAARRCMTHADHELTRMEGELARLGIKDEQASSAALH